jgi:hypothetical protein
MNTITWETIETSEPFDTPREAAEDYQSKYHPSEDALAHIIVKWERVD